MPCNGAPMLNSGLRWPLRTVTLHIGCRKRSPHRQRLPETGDHGRIFYHKGRRRAIRPGSGLLRPGTALTPRRQPPACHGRVRPRLGIVRALLPREISRSARSRPALHVWIQAGYPGTTVRPAAAARNRHGQRRPAMGQHRPRIPAARGIQISMIPRTNHFFDGIYEFDLAGRVRPSVSGVAHTL